MRFVFFDNLILSTIYFCFIGEYASRYKISNNALFCFLFPIFLLWIVICGGQDNVGTDYLAYYRLFSGDDLDLYFDNREYVFGYIILIANYLGGYGQVVFYIFYSLNIFFLFLVLRRIDSRNWAIFVLLLFVITGIFNNQLNVLRQATTTYIATYAILIYNERKYIYYFFLIMLASMIHFSSLILLSVYFIPFLFNMSKKNMTILLFSSFLLGVIFSYQLLYFLPISLIQIVSSKYSWYIEAKYAPDNLDLFIILTKYLYIPFYLLSLIFLDKMNLSVLDKKLYVLGFISFCLRLLVLNTGLLSRIFDSLLIVSIFPLLYYMRYLFTKRNRLFFIITLVLFAIYFTKTVIFPAKEYLYKSIYF